MRDLHKNSNKDCSYSERMIYESALSRLATEISIRESISKEDAVMKFMNILKDKTAAA